MDAKSAAVNGDLSRRALLKTTANSLVGLGISGLAAAAGPGNANANTRTFGRAKSVMVLYLYGAPSQMDTLDPKPEAFTDNRGDFEPIATSLPGIFACEHLPNIAKNLHRVCLVRSMTHSSNNHAVSVALSGLSKSEPVIEANGKDLRHWPYFGSVLEYLWSRQGIEAATVGLPINVILPWNLNAKTDPNRWSPHAAWLGRSFDPVCPQFIGSASREVGRPSANGPKAILSRFDPNDGITPESTFQFDGSVLPEGVPGCRLSARRSLLGQLEGSIDFRTLAFPSIFDVHRRAAFGMIDDARIAEAVDVTREPDAVRESYGLTLFGQEVLAARRLIQAGVKVVTAFWDDYAYPNNAWDTHFNHFPRLKDGLCPTFDQVLPALLDDLERTGLIHETLVMVISEHGRTPHISRTPGGGREHWAGAYWEMFFGAGIKTGQVIGATDRQGGYPTSQPIDPKDILATMYHLIGFDPELTTIPDRLDRPMRLVPHGRVVTDLIA
jgi:hypothetical protein